MDTHNIISELEEYSAKAGLAVSTVCRNATGNPRLFERLKRRIERANADACALREYMAANPTNELPEGRN